MLETVKIAVVSLAALSNLLIGLVVLLRNPKKRINFSFFLFSLIFTLWGFCLLLYEFPIVLTSYFWIKATYFVVSIMVVIILYFSYIFPVAAFKKAWLWAGIASTVFMGFTVWLLFFTKLWIVGVVLTPDRGMQTLLGAGYTWWLFSIWTFGIWTFINLIIKSRRFPGLHGMQLKYIFYGYAFWAILINIPDTVIPLFFNDTRYFSISPIFNIIFSSTIAYTILKHRLMDIRLVLARSVSYSLLSVILIGLYTFSLFAIGHWIFPEASLNGNQLIISVALALVVAYTFQPLRRFLERITESIFFKENYDSEDFLKEVSFSLASTIDLKELTQRVLGRILSTMYLDGGGLLLLKDHQVERIIGYEGNDRKLALSTGEIKILLSQENSVIVFDDLSEESSLKEIMREAKIGCFIQLKAKDIFVGILALGEKKSGEIYTNNDLEVLEILASQLAIAIQNAKQYEEIQQFSRKLEREVKQATKDLELANEKLKEMDKRKNEFLSVAAHELRAPMTAIKGYLSMILEGDAGEISQTVKEYLKQGVEGNERLIRLVNNMLNVARIEEGRLVYQMGTVSLKKVVETIFSDFKAETEKKKLGFDLEAAPDLKDQVYVDQDRIHEVVTNLISNAIKYTDEGSVVVKLNQSNQQKIRFEVVDTGEGISEEEQEKLFQKFFRAESTTGKKIGSGLGLYISKLLVEKFKGTIGVKSVKNQGSTFWFELPLKKEI